MIFEIDFINKLTSSTIKVSYIWVVIGNQNYIISGILRNLLCCSYNSSWQLNCEVLGIWAINFRVIQIIYITFYDYQFILIILVNSIESILICKQKNILFPSSNCVILQMKYFLRDVQISNYFYIFPQGWGLNSLNFFIRKIGSNIGIT